MGKVIINDNRDHANQCDAANHAHTMATIGRAFQQVNGTEGEAVVYLNNRGTYISQPDWLEHVIRVAYANGGGITIGAIQREPGAKSEFHS